MAKNYTEPTFAVVKTEETNRVFFQTSVNPVFGTSIESMTGVQGNWN